MIVVSWQSNKPKYILKLLKYLSDEHMTRSRKLEIVHTLSDCMAYANALENGKFKDVITEFKNECVDVSQTNMSEKRKTDVIEKFG